MVTERGRSRVGTKGLGQDWIGARRPVAGKVSNALEGRVGGVEKAGVGRPKVYLGPVLNALEGQEQGGPGHATG